MEVSDRSTMATLQRGLRDGFWRNLRLSADRLLGLSPEKNRLTLGFVPLTDCAPLVLAQEKGFFARYGLDVTLSREASWANIRDKVAAGVLDAAQMLAPMPLAATLGIDSVNVPMLTALTLDLNGNAITVSRKLFEEMRALKPSVQTERPLSAAGLRLLVEDRRARSLPPLKLAMVSPFSTHNYQLRYWLAAAGIDPDRDVQLLVIPPPFMVDNLEAGNIDGYCVGEPWNSLAVQRGIGRILVSSYEIWNNGPEKVLGVTERWANEYPKTHRRLLMALLQTGRWLDDEGHRGEAAEILAGKSYVDAPAAVIRDSLQGRIRFAPELAERLLPDFNVFSRYAANFPWRSQALWFMSQMQRWGQLSADVDLAAVAARVFRGDIYREAAAALKLNAPLIDEKPEGTHSLPWTLSGSEGGIAMGADAFLDGVIFEPSVAGRSATASDRNDR